MAAQVGKFVLQLTQTVVLARLLAPEAFGLIAMVTAVTGMVGMFKDAGLSMATVQREKVTHAQVSMLFWVNVALSLALMVVVAALAPLLVRLYDEPRLLEITLVIAGTFIFAGLGIQHEAILKRQMRFLALAAVDMLSLIVAIAVAIVLAFYGASYWALVGMLVAQPIMRSALVWPLTRWRPGLPRRGTGVRSMLAFGGNLTGFNFINYFSRNADNVLIGWYWGASALGLYTRAYTLMMLPIGNLRAPLNTVAIPALSRLQDEPERYRSYYTKLTSLLAFGSMPFAAILFLTADSIIPLALGPHWSGASEIVQVFSLLAFLQPSATLRGTVLLSSGRPDRQLRLGLGLAVISILSFIVGLPWGALGVAAAYTAANYLSLWPSLLYTFHGTPIAVADYFRSTGRPASASAIAGVTTFVLMHTLQWGRDTTMLPATIIIFLLTYLATFCLLPGGSAELQGYYASVRLLRRKQNL